MSGKFPACVMMIELSASNMDVNIHPSKAEVRFTNEKDISDAIFFAVKNAFVKNGLIYEFDMKPAQRKSFLITEWVLVAVLLAVLIPLGII